jgi:hypothetical protein
MTVDGEDDLLVAAAASGVRRIRGLDLFEPRQADGPMWPR